VRALHRELPDDREAAELGIAACIQLLTASWRFGTTIGEARTLLREGQALASSIGDRRAHLTLSITSCNALLAAGDVAEALELALENRRAALELDDIGVEVLAASSLLNALSLSGRLPEALELAEEGLARFPRHVPAYEWMQSLSLHAGLSFWRAISLGWMGRLPEAFEEFERCRRLGEEDGTPLEIAGYALVWAAEAHYHAHDAERAHACARQAEQISRSLVEPPVMAAAIQRAFAHAHLAAGRAADAIESARSALDLYERVYQSNMVAAGSALAEALLQAGDPAAAAAAAEQAIALCRRSLSAHYEAVAHGVLARALLRRDGAAARDAVEAALARAAEGIERSGAKTLAPALCEWRAELAAVLGDAVAREALLREAELGYAEIGAPLHAERLTRELAS
jgi:tetratricopeptide (TPR) repeat protein